MPTLTREMSSEDLFFNALAWAPAANATLDSPVGKPIDGHSGLTLVIHNTLNQAITYNVLYSLDGGATWLFYGAGVSLAANSGVTATETPGLSARPRLGLFKIRLTAGATPPTSGAITMSLHRAGVPA